MCKNPLYHVEAGARPLDASAAELAKLHGEPTAVVRYRETLSTEDHALLLLADAMLDRAHGQRLVLTVDQFWLRGRSPRNNTNLVPSQPSVLSTAQDRSSLME